MSLRGSFLSSVGPLTLPNRYRLTGDKKWQDRGWKMFVSWAETATLPGGMSSIADVSKDREHVVYTDNMESFAFAETFK